MPSTLEPALLLDIEGTTTSISFVYDVLFPYAKARLAGFVAEHAGDAGVQQAITLLAADAVGDETKLPPSDRAVAVAQRQMAGDVKAQGLKALQGLIWKEGYQSGSIKGHVYDDVPAQLNAWKGAGRPAAIYSSGSVLAQQLLFGHSTAGDLRPLLCGWYDTAVGHKRSAASYTAIATAWGLAPAQIRFCTDQPAEAIAALQAGMDAIVLMRPGNAPLPARLPCAVHADLRGV